MVPGHDVQEFDQVAILIFSGVRQLAWEHGRSVDLELDGCQIRATGWEPDFGWIVVGIDNKKTSEPWVVDDHQSAHSSTGERVAIRSGMST